jgi:hypothetical protein
MAGAGGASKADLERVVLEAQHQIQMQAQQALMEKMNTICFRRCVPSPMDVGDRQRRCLQQCVGAFLEGWGVAVRFFLRMCGDGRRSWYARAQPRARVSHVRPRPSPARRPSLQNETFASIAKKQMASQGGGHE